MQKNPNDLQALQRAVESFKECTPIFLILADENRQKILIELAKFDRLNVSQLDEKIKLSRPAISHHLKLLKVAGLIDSEKVGTENFYFMTIKDTVESLKGLINVIEDTCFLK